MGRIDLDQIRNELGPLVFLDQTNKNAIVVVRFASFLFASLGIFYLIKQQAYMPHLLFGLSGILTIGSFIFGKKSFECRRSGFIKSNLLGRVVLRFSDVEKMSFSGTSYYKGRVFGSEGVLDKTEIAILLWKFGEGNWIGVYKTCLIDTELNWYIHVRDSISAVIANRLADQLKTDLKVKWGQNVIITKDGITDLTGKTNKAPVTIPFSGDLRFNIKDGIFRLLKTGYNDPLLVIRCSEVNFYPGLGLIGQLINGDMFHPTSI